MSDITKIPTIFRSLMGIVLVSILGTALPSCTEDIITIGNEVEEGVPVELTLKFTVPEMDVVSRSLTPEQERSVSNIWIGIYSATTGKLLNELPTEGYYTVSGDAAEHTQRLVSNIKTVSGSCYIVAVGNVTQNLGITDDDVLLNEIGASKGDHSLTFDRILAKADTWEKYLSISHVLNQADNIQNMTPTLPMSGSYVSGSQCPTAGTPEVVTISPSKAGQSVTLPGSIHLRRLVAKNKVIVKTAQYVTFEPTSWQLINNPVISYLHEQDGNSADVSTYFSGTTGNFKYNYYHSPLSYQFDTEADGVSFEFYQLENKHTGLAWDAATGTGIDNDYTYRDAEFKNADGTNTGIYKSLVRSATESKIGDVESMNNRASYIQVSGTVTYYIRQNDDDEVLSSAQPVAPGTANSVQRTGYVTYTFHLGYIGNDAYDFNCRRNTNYTYTMTINSLNNIVVEAMSNGENQPGAEGDVLDSTNDVIELDAHYAAFNVQLTEDEVRSLSYEIRAPYGNEIKAFRRVDNKLDNAGEDMLPAADGSEDQFVNWVRMRPTTGANVIANYYDNGEAFTLEEMRTGNHLSNNGYYTVFIDENVYHFDANGNPVADTGNEVGQDWTKFVNKPDRIFNLIAVRRGTSPDGESTYGQYKYAIRQKSIQTYYNTTGDVAAAALGAEHINESYGLNLRWSSLVATPSGGWNPDNGRWNMAHYVRNKSWNTFVNLNTLMSVPAINNNNMVAGWRTKPATTYNVPQMRPIDGSTTSGGLQAGQTLTRNEVDPQRGTDFYEIMTQCLSRNRDLNGNGVIDANEIRWYLPAMGKYARLMIGRNSLVTPLFNPSDVTPPGVNDPYNNNTEGVGALACFHYASSDNLLLMSEGGLWIERFGFNATEGTTTGNKSGYALAWQVRCIRNLGANMTDVIESDPVQRAYIVDKTTRTIEMKYYEQNAVRTAYYGEGQPMTTHGIFDAQNLPYRKFQYAEKDVESVTGVTPSISNSFVSITSASQLTYNIWGASVDANALCSRYSEDGAPAGSWRVPNQTELTILRRETTDVFNVDGLYNGGNVDNAGMWCWPSCTVNYLGTSTVYMGIYFNNHRQGGGATNRYWSNTANLDIGYSSTQLRLRCVRDIRE